MITSQFGVSQTPTFTVNNFYLTVKGTNIFVRRIIPKNCEKKATFLIVHGFGEHSGLFLGIAEHLIKKQYEVLMVDLKGFGYSGCGRQNTSIFEMEESVLAVIQEADILKPLILFGHSMGALVCTSLIIDYPHLNIASLIVEAPFLGMPAGRQLPWHKLQLIKYFGNNFHTVVLNSMVNVTSISKNNNHIKNIVQDCLVSPFLNLPLVQSMILSIEKCHKHANLISTPYLILHGTHDLVTMIGDSLRILPNLGTATKKLVKIQGGYHQMHHDEQKQQMLREMDKWVSDLNMQPLGIVNKAPRKWEKDSKNRKWIILGMVASLFVILRLLGVSGIKNKVLGSLMYVSQLIRAT